jgi:hypothetical protein
MCRMVIESLFESSHRIGPHRSQGPIDTLIEYPSHDVGIQSGRCQQLPCREKRGGSTLKHLAVFRGSQPPGHEQQDRQDQRIDDDGDDHGRNESAVVVVDPGAE